ncbi:MAG: ankyrin repeat domain-containing protein [Proteobacteria bacterium]|nr:ankyrin repeat domain-containing protein [Pseudomonadota bacterium]
MPNNSSPDFLFNHHLIQKTDIDENINLICELLSGRYRQAKKLVGMTFQGQPVYRAKTDKKERLVFTYVMNEGKKKLFILCLNDHDYKELKRKLSKATIEPTNNMALPELTEILEPLVPEANPENCTCSPAVTWGNKTHILQPFQQKILDDDSSIKMLIGPAGSTKSCILSELLLIDSIESVSLNAEIEATSSNIPTNLMLLPNKAMIEKMSKHPSLAKEKPVQLLTWNALLQADYSDRTLIASHAFAEWLNKLKIIDNPKVLYYEFGIIAALGSEGYLKLGKRQCYFSEQEKKQKELIQLFKKWQAYLDENKLIDPMVMPLNPNSPTSFANAAIDEAQNLPLIAIASLLKKTKGKFNLAFDIEQSFLSSPYLYSCIKYLFGKNFKKECFTTTWRNSPEIVTVANHLDSQKRAFDAGKNRRLYAKVQSGLDTEGVVSLVDKSHLPQLKGGSSDSVVIVNYPITDAERSLINQELGTNNILTVEEALGIDYERAILWNPFSGNTILISLKNKQDGDGLTIEQWNELNALGIAITRAKSEVYLYDREQAHWQGLSKKLLGETVGCNQIKTRSNQTNPEEERLKWMTQIDYHLAEGRIDRAKGLMLFHLQMDEKAIQQKINEFLPSVAPLAEPAVPSTNSFFAPKKSGRAPSRGISKATSSTTLKLSQNKSKASTSAPDALQGLKSIFIRINDPGVFKHLLESPIAETYLFDISLKKIHSSYQEPCFYAWVLNTDTVAKKYFLDALDRYLNNLATKYSKAKLPELVQSLLVRQYDNTSLIGLLLNRIPQLKNYKKLVELVKKSIPAEKLKPCLSANFAHLYVKEGDLKALEIFKAWGGDFSIINDEGYKAIHIAVIQNKLEILKFLLSSDTYSKKDFMSLIELCGGKPMIFDHLLSYPVCAEVFQKSATP